MDLEEVIEGVKILSGLPIGKPQWTEGFTEETEASIENSLEDEAYDDSTGFDDAEEYTEG